MKKRLKLAQLKGRIKEKQQIIITMRYTDTCSSLHMLKGQDEYSKYINGEEAMMAEVRRYKEINGKFYIDAMAASYVDNYLMEYDRKENS